MRIIGPKDYYDYLIGVYGIDDAIVMDRRDSTSLRKIPLYNNRFVHPIGIAFCGVLYQGVINTKLKQGYWRYDVISFCDKSKPKKSNPNHLGDCLYYGKDSSGTEYQQYIMNSTEHTKINDQLNCPVIALMGNKSLYGTQINIENWDTVLKLPLGLAEYGFSSIINPEDAYKTIYNWLIERKNEKDINVLNDQEKIESKGFDKKTSFRHRK